MSPRTSPSRRAASSGKSGDASGTDGGVSLITAAAVALWFARWLVPAESAPQGETLWLAAAWIALAAAFVYAKFRAGVSVGEVTVWDIGLGLIVLGQAIGAANVWWNGGHLRHAVNGFWEWAGIAISTSMMLRLLSTSTTRERFTATMMTFLVLLAGFGIWQHYVWYPQIAAKYREMIAELDGEISAARRHEIETALAQAGFPADRQSRVMFEQRLFSSTEPIGFFALTNTLAGLLVVGTLIGAFGLVTSVLKPDGDARIAYARRKVVASACGIAVIAVCLLLTKSRTAWVGAAGAAAIGGWLIMRRLPLSRTVWLRGGIVVLAMLILAISLLAFGGGLDRQVLSEAPKSLKYRLEYWSGTWQVIRRHPLAGVGPGNFRPHYLQHKLPESSEEIADPHQMILDLWVQGGLVALLGLGVLTAEILRRIGRATSAAEPVSSATDATAHTPWVWGSAGSFALVLLYQFVSSEPLDQRLVVCGVAFAVLLPIGLKSFTSAYAAPVAYGLAATALAIHLQGAGGISMPAVAQLAFLLPAWACGVNFPAPSTPAKTTYREPIAIAVFVAALVAALTTAVLPTWRSRLLIAQGDAVVFAGQSPRIAADFYLRAAHADDWDPQSHERLAQLWFREWSAGGDEEAFDRSEAAMRDAMARDPLDHNPYEMLGRWYLERHERTGKPSDAATAAQLFEEAVARYPTNAELHWHLAIARHAAGDREPAKSAARTAVELDEINRRYSHIDKYLTAEQRERLEPLLKVWPDQ